MSFKSIVRELREMRDGIGSMSRRGTEGKLVQSRARSQNAGGNVFRFHGSSGQQSRWANLPPELLLDVISRVEASEALWPARKHVVACASVCRSWREITKEIVKTPEECGRLTFPISLKQVFFFFYIYSSSSLYFYCYMFVVWYAELGLRSCCFLVFLSLSLGHEICPYSALSEGNELLRLTVCI